jgi:hypothetical protein
VIWVTRLTKTNELSLDPQCCDGADTLIVWRADDHCPVEAEKSEEFTGYGARIFQALDDLRTQNDIEAFIRSRKRLVQIGVDPKHFRRQVEWFGKNIRSGCSFYPADR